MELGNSKEGRRGFLNHPCWSADKFITEGGMEGLFEPSFLECR